MFSVLNFVLQNRFRYISLLFHTDVVNQECSPAKKNRNQTSEQAPTTARRVLSLISNDDSAPSTTSNTSDASPGNSKKKTTRVTRRNSRALKKDKKDPLNSPTKENIPTSVNSPKEKQNCARLVLKDVLHTAPSKARVLEFTSPSKSARDGQVKSPERNILGSPRPEIRALFSSPKNISSGQPLPQNSSPIKPMVNANSPARRSIFGTPKKENFKSPTKEDIRSPFKTPTRPAPKSPALKNLASPVIRSVFGGSSHSSPRRAIFTSPPPTDVRQSPRKNNANPYSSAVCKFMFRDIINVGILRTALVI